MRSRPCSTVSISFWLSGSLLLSAHAFTYLVQVHDSRPIRQRSLHTNHPHVNRNIDRSKENVETRSLLFSSSSASSSSSNYPPPDQTADTDTPSSAPSSMSSSSPSFVPKIPEIFMEFKVHTSIGSIPAVDWDACVNHPPAQHNMNNNNSTSTEQSSPFLEHSWMHTLEASECASHKTGWVPQHVSIHWKSNNTSSNGQQKKQCFGYVPLYIKGNSLGEFIFDQEWAQAAYQNNIDYYPKLLVGVPFTPVTGSRILWHPDIYQHYNLSEVAELRKQVGTFLKQSTQANQLSSIHWNFVTDQEATDLTRSSLLGDDNSKKTARAIPNIFGSNRMTPPPIKDEYMRRTSLQYHWHNRNPNNNDQPYESFDDYLSCFKSKRRINIRRERRKVSQDAQIHIQAVTGRDILEVSGLVERMYEIYLSTIEKMYYGRQYLTLDFFQKLAQSSFIDNLCFMCARYKSTGEELRAKDVFAGTFNVVKDGVFYGRYWGCLPVEDIKNLHFETCYWSAIEYCIANGLKRMEPGAGGGDYKWARGFDPELIHSVHYISHPGLRRAVGEFLEYETENNVELTEYLLEKSAVGSKVAANNKS